MSHENTRRARAVPAAVSVLLAAAVLMLPATAQEKEKEKAKAKAPEAQGLEQLLQQIEQLPAGAWEARVAQLQAAIDARKKAAAGLRKQAGELQQKAAAEDRQAAAIGAEIKRLRSLMALIQPKPATPKAAAKWLQQAKITSTTCQTNWS